MVAGITDWILSLNGWFALAVVFLVSALEASAFLGFLFPGEIAVILGGVLAFDGRVALLGVIVAAVAGAIVGDTVGYFVGRRWGRQILRGAGGRVPFLRHEIDEHLERAQAYVRRRRGSAVFFGRFTAALRVMVPGLAGMAEIPYGRFAVYNAAGARSGERHSFSSATSLEPRGTGLPPTRGRLVWPCWWRCSSCSSSAAPSGTSGSTANVSRIG